MSNMTRKWVIAAIVSLALAGAARVAAAEPGGASSRIQVSVLGGLQLLNKNDTALPDRFLNVPLVGAVSYHLAPNWAVEGELTWMIPVQQSVDTGPGPDADLKSPDVLAYQAAVRASLPLTSWTPYLAAGVGAVTFLSNDDADRMPRLSESHTAFALSFGGGATYGLGSKWGLRADFRELVAFPSSDAAGLSSGGSADPIWMERLAVGLDYRF